ncbi:glycosyltransferase family 2 protein [Amylibacter sp.]|nr:glycosyltransferase family 2 protein [Amylibacter sp.]MDB4095647.1 glycosyltransferase family 2 protein [Amylibacter sp.]
MKISLLITCTNPTKLKYLTFFATVKSWHKKVDEIIISDGGTTDGSFERLTAEERSKCKIISNDNTKWEINEGFSPNHINSMLNEGIRHASGDWLFIIGADFVLDEIDRESLEKELHASQEDFWVRFSRRKAKTYEANNWSYEYDSRGTVALNLNMVRNLKQFPYMMGLLDKNNIIYDYPILAKEFAKVCHNKTGPVIIPRGDKLVGGEKVLKNISVFVSDHFFYDFKMAYTQRKLFFEYFNSRMTASANLTQIEISRKIGKTSKKINQNEFELLSAPKEFKDLINQNIKSDCLGMYHDQVSKNYDIMIFFSRLRRKILSYFLRRRGLFSAADKMFWSIELENTELTELNKIYEIQDKYL